MADNTPEGGARFTLCFWQNLINHLKRETIYSKIAIELVYILGVCLMENRRKVIRQLHKLSLSRVSLLGRRGFLILTKKSQNWRVRHIKL